MTLILVLNFPGSCFDSKLNVTVLVKLNPNAMRNQQMKKDPNDALSKWMIRSVRSRPRKPVRAPKARMYRSGILRMRKRFRKRKGKIAMPPRAIKFPDANGDQLNCEAVKTAIFASHPLRVKKQVMANQHIVTMTPH